MIITRTPFRMSFLGGGTDYPPFFLEHGGSVISTTFDKYCYVTVRHLPHFFEYRNQVTYGKIERVVDIDEIEHPAVRNAMKMLDMYDLRIVYEADLPARSGLGSSSSFAVGMLNGFHALKGKYAGVEKLAEESIYLERELCAESGGWQDQIAVAYGGLNRIDFKQDGGFSVRPIIMPRERKELLNDHLMLFFTGFTRISGNIATAQETSVKRKTLELLEILSLVDDGEHILEGKGDLRDFGRLLDYTWQLKRGLTSCVSNDSIDAIYQKAQAAGAIGGKLMGAGGGGFFMLFVEPEKQQAVREALHDLLYVPFRFEDSGASILYYHPEEFDLTFVPPIDKEEARL